MKHSGKHPARFLVIIPIMVILDIVILSVAAYHDSHIPHDPQNPLRSLPWLSLAAIGYLVPANAAGALTAVILSVIAAVTEKKENQKEKIMKTINIAIDGPGGAGKSSISKAIASELGFIHVDTGAMYRAIALFAVRNHCTAPEQIRERLDEIDVELKFIGGAQRVMLCGEDVTDYIRSPEVTMTASEVSAVPEVRAHLFDLQKKIAAENNIIMDGRDIGSVVLPHADLKIFLTASAEERASRRYLEMREKPDCPSYEDILEDIRKRDYADMHREVAPLVQAEDAVLLDSTNMGFNEVVEHITGLIRTKTDLR